MTIAAYLQTGDALLAAGQIAVAIAQYRRALALQPQAAQAHERLGTALHQQGQLALALAHYQQAITLEPDGARAYGKQGMGLMQQGDLPKAIQAFQQALALNPHHFDAHLNLGVLFHDPLDYDRMTIAIRHYQQALALQPDSFEAQTNLGLAYLENDHLDCATYHFQRAWDLRPTLPEAAANLGILWAKRGALEPAIAYYRQALALNPEYAEAHYNLGLALLQQGQWQQGWPEYEWRWRCRAFHRPTYGKVAWDGGPLEGKGLLILTDGGFGDILQLMRYVPLMAAQGDQILFRCPRPLWRLLTLADLDISLVEEGDPQPPGDRYTMLMSLPHHFQTTLETIPSTFPYLKAPENSLALPLLPSSRLKVGIVWASGYPKQVTNFASYKARSCSLALMMQYLALPGVTLYSLQVGRHSADVAPFRHHPQLIDLSGQLQDFADTAAAIVALDLVISVDTAVVHLAGALGKPVWAILPFACDWRWLETRGDSPWYPSLRLFRQPQPGDWAGVLQQVAAAIGA